MEVEEEFNEDELLQENTKYIDSLDDSIKKSIRRYTANHYREINDSLRLDPNFTSVDIRNIDKAFDQAPKLEFPLVVFKGKTSDYIYKIDNAYVSTSLSEEIADEYIFYTCCVLQITVSPGSKILYLRSISLHPTEEEILLDRGGSFIVTGTEIVENVKYMYVTYTPRRKGKRKLKVG